MKILNLIYIISFLLSVQVFAQTQSGRAMWVWNSQYAVDNIVNDVDSTREEIFAFCRAPHGEPEHQINTLFFSCRDGLFGNKTNLRNFISEASDSGMVIEYLDGDPSWATYNQSVAWGRLKLVVNYNADCTSDKEKFSGVQYDVEPYLLKASSGYKAPYWDTDRDSVWSQFLIFADSCQKIVDADTSLYFGIAIPRWYENHVGKDQLKLLQSKVDYCAIMDYNESGEVMTRDAENEVLHADSLGKKVWIGAETKQLEPETVSFYEEGVEYMESQLDIVEAAYENNPSFLGFAIHAYKYYPSLKSTTAIPSQGHLPQEIQLYQNNKNPFKNKTTIAYELNQNTQIELSVYNALGQKITTLVRGKKSKGLHSATWLANQFPAGIYFYRLTTPSQTISKKMVLLR